MRRFTNVNYYAVLGVTSDASHEQIRAAYRTKVRTAHPDTGGDHEKFAQIAEAWEVLGNAEERELYDADSAAAPPARTRHASTATTRARRRRARPRPRGPRRAGREQWMKNKRRL